MSIASSLHTDVLEKKFGKVRARVLSQVNNLRIIDIIDEKDVVRTHAMTFFTLHLPDEIKPAIEEIKSGALIGKTLIKHGYQVEKTTLDRFRVKKDNFLQNKFGDSQLCSRIYKLKALRNKKSFLVGIICEINVCSKQIANNKWITYSELLEKLTK